MKYLIHSHPNRRWYVDYYLIPSMKEQGIEYYDIMVWEDKNQEGNLKSWINCCEWIVSDNNTGMFVKEHGIWHLQDDVIISEDFRERTESHNVEYIGCGFRNDYFDKTDDRYKLIGKQPMKDMVFSFPCIYIPNYLIKGFLEWFEKEVVIGRLYEKFYKENKYDDMFFTQFLKRKHEDLFAYHYDPCLVDHIDYLLGGTIANINVKNRRIYHRTVNFENQNLVKELESELVIQKYLEERYGSSAVLMLHDRPKDVKGYKKRLINIIKNLNPLYLKGEIEEDINFIANQIKKQKIF